jgi:hypothetical protein
MHIRIDACAIGIEYCKFVLFVCCLKCKYLLFDCGVYVLNKMHIRIDACAIGI